MQQRNFKSWKLCNDQVQRPELKSRSSISEERQVCGIAPSYASVCVFLSQHCCFHSDQTQGCAALLHLSWFWAWEGCRLQSLSVHFTLAKSYQDNPVCSWSFCVVPQELVQVSVSPAVPKLCRGCLAVCASLESCCGLWNHRIRWQLPPALGLPKEKRSHYSRSLWSLVFWPHIRG